MSKMFNTHDEVLKFWFKECDNQQWFTKDDAFDATIAERFGMQVEKALNGNLDDWAGNPDGLVALIIMLDQFTRNIFRDTAKAYAGDQKALSLSLKGQEQGVLNSYDENKRYFTLMPMMHSEDLAIQDASLPLFNNHTNENVHGYAVNHRDIVAKFGRFPHRNEILGRDSTAEEIEFLKGPGSSF